MVPDVKNKQKKNIIKKVFFVKIYQIFIKGKGIFTNIASKSHKAKLRYFIFYLSYFLIFNRVLYEVGHLAHLVEKAGGKSSNGEISLMDLEINSYD